MLEALQRAGYGPCRAYMLRFVDFAEWEFCLLHSVGCPMAQPNIFDDLRVALKAMDSDELESIILIRVPKMIKDSERSAEIGEAIINVFTGLPEMWGGEPLERTKIEDEGEGKE